MITRPEMVEPEETITWRHLLPDWRCAFAVSGARGSGKSSFIYWLAGVMAARRSCKVEILGLNPEKQSLLPDNYIIRESLYDVTRNSVVIVDEASLQFHARKSQSNDNMQMDHMMDISRQENNDIIFATHSFRKMDVNIVSDLDFVILKRPSFLHRRFERPSIRSFTEAAADFFDKFSGKDFREWAYVFSDYFEGPIKNGLPDFWSEELSCGWASTGKYHKFFKAVGITLTPAQVTKFEEDKIYEPYRTLIDEKDKFSSYQAKMVLKILKGEIKVDW